MSKRAFTLIELILVMAILTAIFALTAPSLSRFFRGRTLDSEARRLLALTRQAQSRAASEGIPMDLWIDSSQNAYGLEAQPAYEENDTKAVEFPLDSDLTIEISNLSKATADFSVAASDTMPAVNSRQKPGKHSNLPRIRFLPDGSVSEDSPQLLKVAARDGNSLWITLSRTRMNYELQNRPNI